MHKCATILTIGGRIVKQDWENVDYVLYINPLLQITDKTPKSYENIPLCQRWEDDMQIFSQYLDSRVKTFSASNTTVYIICITEFSCHTNEILLKRSSGIK